MKRNRLGLILMAFVLSAERSSAQQLSSSTVWQGTVGGAAVSLVSQWVSDPNDARYRVDILPAGATQSTQVSLRNALGASPTVNTWNGQRLLIIVGDVLSIVDVPTATLSDQFVASSPAISSDSR